MGGNHTFRNVFETPGNYCFYVPTIWAGPPGGPPVWDGAKSLQLGGTDEYVDYGSNPWSTRTASTAYSFSIWFKPANLTGNQYLLGSLGGLRLPSLQQSGSIVYAWNAAGYTFATGQLVAGTWVHLAVTCPNYTTTRPTLYANGTAVGFVGASGLGTWDATDSWLSGQNLGAGFLTGNLSSLVWSIDTQWTADNVTTLYNGGTLVDPSTTDVPYTDTVALGGYEGDDATGTTGVMQSESRTNNGTPIATEEGDLVADTP